MGFIFFSLLSLDSNADEEINFNWLDPDKKVYVLQNRLFTKGLHLQGFVVGGAGLSNPYRQVQVIDSKVSFFFNEFLGLELNLMFYFNSINTTYTALTVATTVIPNVRELRSFYGAKLMFAPWYAKVNFFNAILYFDWYLGVGAGILNSALDYRTSVSAPSNFQPESLVSGIFSTGHLFHLGQHFFLRLDVNVLLYSAVLSAFSNTSNLYTDVTINGGIGFQL